MRLFLALCVVVLALAAWFALPSRPVEERAEPPVGSTPRGAHAVAETEATDLEPIEVPAATSRSVPNASPDTAGSSQTPSCHVFGRVVDEHGAPLGEVHVTWRELDAQNVELCRIKCVTSEDGRFRFDVPLPASQSQRLAFFSSELRDKPEHAFGTVKRVATRRLTAGDNDLGDFRLESRGVVVGRVVTDAGVPVEGLLLALDGAAGQSGLGMSDNRGHFRIAHVRPGRASVIVRERHWTARTKPVVDVVAEETTNAADVVVFETPAIQGVVHDAAGVPLDKITVLGTSSRGTNGFVKAQSDERGTFTMYVTDEGPWTLEVKPVGEFLGWGAHPGDPTCTFEPGRGLAGIVLERAPRMTFRIVDEQSRAPIDRFGLRVTERSGPGPGAQFPGQEIELEHHPQGETQAPVRGESVVAVAAPGYADLELPVAADPGASGVQTIGMIPASGIAGRVVLHDKPVAHAAVRLRRDTPRTTATNSSAAVGSLGKSRAANVIFPDRPRALGANEDGHFAFTSLAAGSYALEIDGTGGGRKLLSKLVVPAREVLQLGEIALDAEALVRVVVKPAPNQSPIGYRVTLDVSGTHRIGGTDGACLFRGVAAGPHWIVWEHPDEQRGVSSSDRRRIEFELRAGETREIVIDAAKSAPCQVTVRVLRHGTPVADVFVNARIPRNPPIGGTEWRPIGQTDARGIATGSVEGGMRIEIEVLGSSKRVIGVGSRPLDLVASGSVETTVDLESGRLVVELPATLPKPELGSVLLTFPSDVARTSTALTGEPRSLDEFPYQPVWATSSIDFGEVPVGRHEIQLQFQRFVRDPVSDDPKSGRWIPLREPFRATVELKDGEITRVVVP